MGFEHDQVPPMFAPYAKVHVWGSASWKLTPSCSVAREASPRGRAPKAEASSATASCSTPMPPRPGHSIHESP
eukprot:1264159-Alexandrium_andersonii.AAC.1